MSLYDIAGHLKQKQAELLSEIRKTICQYHSGENDSVLSNNFRLEFHPHQVCQENILTEFRIFHTSPKCPFRYLL